MGDAKYTGVLLSFVILVNFVSAVPSDEGSTNCATGDCTRSSGSCPRPSQTESTHSSDKFEDAPEFVADSTSNDKTEHEKSTVTRISYLNKPMVDASESLSETDMQNSYVIENTRFVEDYPKRCWSSTIFKDPLEIEPFFYIIRQDSFRRIRATASPDEILATGFDPNKATTVFIHGFRHPYLRFKWLEQIRNIFREHSHLDRQNLIFLDWDKYADSLYYIAAVRASGFGSFLANFLMKLIELGADPKKMHLIGHSLGAHIAGFAAKRIWPQLGRVTGIDPAGPCFGKVYLNSPQDRISPGDALEVEVYHYDDKFLGSPASMGQIDVFVNGGTSQPGCRNAFESIMFRYFSSKVPPLQKPPSENQRRGVQVSISHIPQTLQCHMVAYECRSWRAFQAGECGYCDQSNSQCFQMDFSFQFDGEPQPIREPKYIREERTNGFYIATSDREPFCTHHFQVKVFTDEPDPLFMFRQLVGGNPQWKKFDLKLTDEQDDFSKITVKHHPEPDVFTYLLLSEKKPRRFTKVHVSLRNHDELLIREVEINYMSSIDPAVRTQLSSRFCAVKESSPTRDKSSDFRWLALEECQKASTT